MDATIKDLLKAGTHFGHQSRYWNPKMAKYIYGTYNHVNIINLEHTLVELRRACEFVHNLARSRKKILFVGTKKAARDIIKQEADSIGQYSVIHRWMGGTLTNYNIISASIRKLGELQKQKADGLFAQLTKKEAMMRSRAMMKLERNIGGIKDMNGLPDALFVVDVRNERIAVAEANKLGIPVIGIVDTNSNPENIDYVIPGNDDSIRSISLFVKKIALAFREGGQLAEQFSMLRDQQPQQETAERPKIAGTLKKKDQEDEDAGKSDEAAPVEEAGKEAKDANAPKEQAKEQKPAESGEPSKNKDADKGEDSDGDNGEDKGGDKGSASAAKKDTGGDKISPQAVKELRETSGAGIMECKQALADAKGDMERAMEILRESGAAKHLKRAERDAKEGTLAVKSDDKGATLVEINCETDFVARNEEFVGFAEKVAESFHSNPPKLSDGTPELDKNTQEQLQEISHKMGEKILISNFVSMEAPKDGTVGFYVHTDRKLCSLVTIDQKDPDLAKDLAMQVTAMSPMVVNPEDVPAELLEKEKKVFQAQIKDEDKPEDIKNKMIDGKLKKFASEIALSEQAFIKDPQQKIKDLLKQGKVKDIKFIRHPLGKAAEVEK